MSDSASLASFTGSIPHNYDTYLGPILFEFSAADMARRVSFALGRPARILEIACGTGISTRHIAGALPPGSEIVATDLNQAMLDHAAKVNGSLPGVTYQQADALELPFENESFDAVVCQFGIMFFPDKGKGMQEMTRVLNPEGFIALNVWESLDKNPSFKVVVQVIKSFFETDPPAFLEVPFGFYDTNVGRKLFLDAGFKEVEVVHVSEAVQVADYSLLARGAVTGNPTILMIEERGDVDAEEIISAATVALEQEFGSAPTELDFQEIVYLARKS